MGGWLNERASTLSTYSPTLNPIQSIFFIHPPTYPPIQVLPLASRAGRPVVGMHKWCLWRSSTST